ncbi:hypothetical protein SCP_0509820 [Sparassis crispa]|uniref:Uncharacterized protein n=1 Tax=Sparassis crispa TaxID=139825 RepID=A0A401GNX5_9APHY|nr:hypothetical protein SCP_0509820 [Sparassis crispa]GBE83923.1 hypothetical protein SCP_0509820 [Sparassis crispa]
MTHSSGWRGKLNSQIPGFQRQLQEPPRHIDRTQAQMKSLGEGNLAYHSVIFCCPCPTKYPAFLPPHCHRSLLNECQLQLLRACG